MRSTHAGFALAATLLLSSSARAVDQQACLNANEKGQVAQKNHRLREAREQFLICGNASCPALVRHDCSQWTADLGKVIPSVVFGARDRGGHDMFDVTVSMDGEVLTQKLDGKSVNVDPGRHSFKFEVAGAPPATEVVLIKESEQSRVISTVLEFGDAPDATKPKKEDPQTTPPREHTIYPWIVVGVGAAAMATGLVLVAITPSRPSNCDTDARKCTPTTGQTQDDRNKDLENANSSRAIPAYWAVAGIGLAVAVGGLVWHFLEPTGPAATSTGVRLSPWSTGKAGGFGLDGTF